MFISIVSQGNQCESFICFISFPTLIMSVSNFSHFGGCAGLSGYHINLPIFYDYWVEHFFTCLLVIMDTLFCQDPVQTFCSFFQFDSFSYRFVGALHIFLDMSSQIKICIEIFSLKAQFAFAFSLSQWCLFITALRFNEHQHQHKQT